ncbi:MAG: AEC family transporter [Clostridiaceae bacterium]|nr:AEC family transporter [Clostridiaceae bacterium]
MDIQVLLKQITELFFMIFLGYGLFRGGLMSVGFNKQLTAFVLNVTTPAMVLSSVLTQIDAGKGGYHSAVPLILLVTAGLFLLFPVFGFFIIKLLRVPKQQQGLYLFMTTFSNIGFMGFPVVNALYGTTAVFYTALVNIIFNIFVFTAGLFMIHYGMESKASIRPKELLSPKVLLPFVSVILYFINVPFPSVVSETVDSIGGLTSPLAMILIGSTLATMNVREVFTEWRIYPYILLKQIAMPLVLYPLLCLLVADGTIRNVLFVLVLMPVANSSILFATEYGADEKLAAKGVFLSTVFSMVSIPLVSYNCTALF